jgi:hypothetical protein
MKLRTLTLAATAVAALASAALAQRSAHSFTFDDTPVGRMTLAGHGQFDAASGFARAIGRFVVTEDITAGPLAGLRVGDAGHWRAIELLPSADFKCAGPEPLKTAFSDDDTAVLKVEFRRQGGGPPETLVANVFVSRLDLNPDAPGVQNVWIQAVGCGEAISNLQ